MVKGKYTTPQGRPRSVPPGIGGHPTLAEMLDDHPFAPGGQPFPDRPSHGTAYGRALRVIYERIGEDLNTVPGPWIKFGDLRRELNCGNGVLANIAAAFKKSEHWEVRNDREFRALKRITVRDPSYTRTRQPAAPAPELGPAAREFLDLILAMARGTTGIPDLTLEQAVGWYRRTHMTGTIQQQ